MQHKYYMWCLKSLVDQQKKNVTEDTENQLLSHFNLVTAFTGVHLMYYYELNAFSTVGMSCFVTFHIQNSLTWIFVDNLSLKTTTSLVHPVKKNLCEKIGLKHTSSFFFCIRYSLIKTGASLLPTALFQTLVRFCLILYVALSLSYLTVLLLSYKTRQ